MELLDLHDGFRFLAFATAALSVCGSFVVVCALDERYKNVHWIVLGETIVITLFLISGFLASATSR